MIKNSVNNLIFVIVTLLTFLLVESSFSNDYEENKVILVQDQDDSLEEDFSDFESFNFDVGASKEVYDPLEKVNRKIFVFNDFLDRNLFEHIAKGYQKSLPGNIRRSVRNFLNNLASPFTIVNSIFQGNVDNTMASFSSFLINSTLGIGGLFDVAGKRNVKYYEEDLGQTFAKYGLGSGPYLMLPFLGPSNFRDTSGLVVKNTVSPLSVNIFKVGDDELVREGILLGLTTVSLIDKRESLLKIMQDLRNNSFDMYATVRSAYSQNRQSEINNENFSN